MTRNQQPQPRRVVKTVGLLTLIATLCVSAPGLASDYPPPPGPYPSGPLPVAAGGGEILDGVQPDAVARPVSDDRPGLLLPDAPDASDPGIYGATNLFGSPPVAADPIPPPAAVFAPTEPAVPYPPGNIEAAPPAPFPPTPMSEPIPTQQAAGGPQTYRSNAPVMTGGGYQPPAYPIGHGVPPYAAPTMPQQPWRGEPQSDVGMPAQPAPAGGPVFRPPGSADN